MSPAGAIARLGFDGPLLRYALRTALAACVALLVAWLLKLEHPQWSAMTVWAASQPTRGQLIEKSFFRLAGTVSGVIAGVVLVVGSAMAGPLGQPVVLVAGLAVWIGLCAGIGNVQRGFVSYGTMLAGYSAAMVALLATAHPDHILVLGADRLLTVFVGVATALATGWLFAAPQAEEAVVGRVRRLSARVLRDMAARLRDTPDGLADALHALLAEMAAIDERLDPHGAGSLRSRRSVRAIRSVLTAELSALLWLRGAKAVPGAAAVCVALEKAAEALEASAPANAVVEAMARAADLSTAHAPLHEVIVRMETALRAQSGAGGSDTERLRLHQQVVLHRDWIGGREALIRSMTAMLAMGTLWLATGWSVGPFMLLGVAIMTSLFSTFDNPALTMRFVLTGQVLGVAGALACRWLAWPLATNGLELVFLTMPFILFGALVHAHRRTIAVSFDYHMVMLLLLQPVYPLSGTFGYSLAVGAAVVSGPIVALAAYKLVYPVDARRRMDTLIAMMVHELRDMAAAPDALKDRHIWRARLYHRLLRLARWAEKTGERQISATNGGLAVLGLGSTVLRIQELLREVDIAPGTARCLMAALRRMRNIGQKPERVTQMLELVAARLSRERMDDAESIRDAAGALAANLDFFRRAAGRS